MYVKLLECPTRAMLADFVLSTDETKLYLFIISNGYGKKVPYYFHTYDINGGFWILIEKLKVIEQSFN